jgi:hypothetical protein
MLLPKQTDFQAVPPPETEKTVTRKTGGEDVSSHIRNLVRQIGQIWGGGFFLQWGLRTNQR